MQQNCAIVNQTHLAHVNLQIDKAGTLQLNIQSIPVKSIEAHDMQNISTSLTIPGTDNLDTSCQNKSFKKMSSPLISQSPASNKSSLRISEPIEQKECLDVSQCLQSPTSQLSSTEILTNDIEQEKNGCAIFNIFTKKTKVQSPKSGKNNKEMRSSNIVTDIPVYISTGQNIQLNEDLSQVQNIWESSNQQSPEQLTKQVANQVAEQPIQQQPVLNKNSLLPSNNYITFGQHNSVPPQQYQIPYTNQNMIEYDPYMQQQFVNSFNQQYYPNESHLEQNNQPNIVYLDQNNVWTSSDPMVETLLKALQHKISVSRRQVKAIYEEIKQQVLLLAQNKIQVLKNYFKSIKSTEINQVVNDARINWHEDIEVTNVNQLKASLLFTELSSQWSIVITQLYFPLELLQSKLIANIFQACRPETIGYIDFRGENSFVAVKLVPEQQSDENTTPQSLPSQTYAETSLFGPSMQCINPSDEWLSGVEKYVGSAICDVLISSDRIPGSLMNLKIRRLILCHNMFENVVSISLGQPEVLQAASLGFVRLENLKNCVSLEALVCHGSHEERDTGSLPSLKRFLNYNRRQLSLLV